MPVWRSIPFFPDYLAAVDGRIKRTKNELTIRYRDDGIPFVRLAVPGGDRDDRQLNYLVALAHVGVPPGWDYTILHRDGDPTNCAADNLAWVPDPYLMERECRWLMRGDVHRYRVVADPTGEHGRIKVATECRKHHPLSLTGKSDANTDVWGYGNRICLRCRDER